MIIKIESEPLVAITEVTIFMSGAPRITIAAICVTIVIAYTATRASTVERSIRLVASLPHHGLRLRIIQTYKWLVVC